MPDSLVAGICGAGEKIMSGIPVLMYHALEDEDHPAGARDPGEQLYVLTVRQFREQMEYLHREGFRTFFLEELLGMHEWPDKAVVLTFDDGHESNCTLALPILQQFGFKAEFFITTGWTGTPNYMTPDQINALHLAGMSIGSHGVSHDFMDDLDESEIERELRESMTALTRITGRKVTSFSAPGGRILPAVKPIAEKLGYRSVFNSTPMLFTEECSRYAIPRFSLTTNSSQADFCAIAMKDCTHMRILKLRNRFLFFAKKFIGNKRYEKVRATLLAAVKQ
jgi:peptidoglycan/xylan/chitin deacetylase (PgdA/CDA1 family)